MWTQELENSSQKRRLCVGTVLGFVFERKLKKQPFASFYGLRPEQVHTACIEMSIIKGWKVADRQLWSPPIADCLLPPSTAALVLRVRLPCHLSPRPHVADDAREIFVLCHSTTFRNPSTLFSTPPIPIFRPAGGEQLSILPTLTLRLWPMGRVGVGAILFSAQELGVERELRADDCEHRGVEGGMLKNKEVSVFNLIIWNV